MLWKSLILFALCSPAQEEAPRPFVWNAQNAEHLLTRAGFGASRERIERAVEEGLEATLNDLFREREPRDPYLIVRYEPTREALSELAPEERLTVVSDARRLAAEQLRDYRVSWFERLLANEDPLRERMLMFWHGHFTTSASVVQHTDKVLRQIETLRVGALGSYADLLHAMARDPAMLEYLDNDENRKKWANENFARELMELFSLGEGEYTEEDVKEAARALTGRRAAEDGSFEFRRSDHDSGLKTIFGVEKRFEGNALVELLLQQEACPRWMAERLITYFEGVRPSDKRIAMYAGILRGCEFEMRSFLWMLFSDPQFYRAEIVGARVTSPLDLMIGTCLRVGLNPPAIFFVVATSILGQELMHPPNVKGWEEGEAWISTSSFLLRGNLQGMLFNISSFENENSSVLATTKQAFAREFRTLRAFGESQYRPRINLIARIQRQGATTDKRIVDFLIEELLATTVEEPTRALLLDYLVEERGSLSIEEGQVHLAGPQGEALLRRLAHLILSLPEAQLS